MPPSLAPRSAVSGSCTRLSPTARCAGGCPPVGFGFSAGAPGGRAVRGQRMGVAKRMTEANEQEANEQEAKRPLTLGRSGTRLELRRPVETGQVRQSFSHGRSKTVTVEVRKKRTLAPGAAPEPGRPEPAAPAGTSIVARAQPAA